MPANRSDEKYASASSSVCGMPRSAASAQSWARISPSPRSSRSTSNSIMSTPASTAASKLANVLPGAMWSAPL